MKILGTYRLQSTGFSKSIKTSYLIKKYNINSTSDFFQLLSDVASIHIIIKSDHIQSNSKKLSIPLSA